MDQGHVYLLKLLHVCSLKVQSDLTLPAPVTCFIEPCPQPPWPSATLHSRRLAGSGGRDQAEPPLLPPPSSKPSFLRTETGPRQCRDSQPEGFLSPIGEREEEEKEKEGQGEGKEKEEGRVGMGTRAGEPPEPTKAGAMTSPAG